MSGERATTTYGAVASPRSTLTVINTHDSGPGSLRQAILEANAGDTIGFALAPNSIITLTTGQLVVTKALTLDGSAASNLTLNADGQSRVFKLSADTAMISIVIANGYAGDPHGGGGIYTTNPLTLTNVTVSSNTVSQSDHDGGGGVRSESDVVLIGGLFQNNSCKWTSCAGGGLETLGALRLNGTQFISNTSWGSGGGASVLYTATLSGGQFRNNTCTAAPDCAGGGLNAGSLYLDNTQFISNSSESFGGGAYVENAATLLGGLFQNNRCVDTILGCAGGGLYAHSSLAAAGTQFISNSSMSGAGGAYAANTVSVQGGLFLNNQCSQPSCVGGGLTIASNFGALSIAETKFIGNVAGAGGGLAQAKYPFAYDFNRRIVNVLFARNTALSGDGAAILLADPGVVQLVHATVTSPTITAGSAISASVATLYITNTIISSHTIGMRGTGSTVYEDYNLLFANGLNFSSNVITGSHSIMGDPSFIDPGADDYHLGAGSVAIDHGANAGVFVDLDRQPRPQGAGPDIGAYEFVVLFNRIFLPLLRR